MKNRPCWDHYWLFHAVVASSRATCVRRKVGAVLVSEDNKILATGYNGKPSGSTNCIDKPCAGHDLPRGQCGNACKAVHAEQNALLQCADVRKIHTCYCVTAPCLDCLPMLLNTGCQRIVFIETHHHSETAKSDWQSYGREWVQVPWETLVREAYEHLLCR